MLAVVAKCRAVSGVSINIRGSADGTIMAIVPNDVPVANEIRAEMTKIKDGIKEGLTEPERFETKKSANLSSASPEPSIHAKYKTAKACPISFIPNHMELIKFRVSKDFVDKEMTIAKIKEMLELITMER